MRYVTLKLEDADRAIKQVAGFEPLIVDDKLVAVIVGGLRIYPKSGELLVSEQREASDD